jgi:beta-glucosidase
MPQIQGYSRSILCFALIYPHALEPKALAWDWQALAATQNYPVKGDTFPKNFIWGVGTSAYQVEGNCNNSTYATWTKTEGYHEPAGITCDHDHKYREDINLMAKELGVNAFRFSIERSKVEPQPGIFNQKELDRYADVCTQLIKNNIRPVIGFHHYSDPQWFMARGGFAETNNIPGFVRYCVTVFKHLNAACATAIRTYHGNATEAKKALRPLYLTFNSPNSYAFSAYLSGTRPPGCKNMQLAATVLKNILQAHVQTYQTLKALPSGKQARIGITHNIYQVDPYHWFSPFQHIKCHFANKFINEATLKFFASGHFTVSIPWQASVNYSNEHAPNSLDFIGLNYYCHGRLKRGSKPERPDDEITTDNHRYTLYAEGLYRAIADVSRLLAKKRSIPIIITENGCATKDAAKLDLFLKRYLYALNKAITDGYPVIGYIWWSLLGNYEWGSFLPDYGLYSVDRTPDAKGKPKLTRTLKPGSQYFIDVIGQHRTAYAKI